ncbi:MAG: phage tail protein [Saccharospirillaceae bacterium]|nr:phage tail protein [Saccharospirillaceae bacterium]MCD8530923.1 phage tail protein [Saccharospirillaceae bacterium]
MSATVTMAGEAFISDVASGSVNLTSGFADTILITYIDDLDVTQPPDVIQSVPVDILHSAPVDRSGLNGDSVAVFNALLRSDVGDFSFNWLGLYNSEHNVLIAVAYEPTQQKWKTDGQRLGNVLNKAFALKIANAGAVTGITVDVQSWQVDYHASVMQALQASQAAEHNSEQALEAATTAEQNSASAVQTANSAAQESSEAKQLATEASQNANEAVNAANTASNAATVASNAAVTASDAASSSANNAQTAVTEANNAAASAAESATSAGAAATAASNAENSAAEALNAANSKMNSDLSNLSIQSHDLRRMLGIFTARIGSDNAVLETDFEGLTVSDVPGWPVGQFRVTHNSNQRVKFASATVKISSYDQDIVANMLANEPNYFDIVTANTAGGEQDFEFYLNFIL